MAKINIPKQVLPGFEIIAKLKEDQVVEICDYISKLPLNTKLRDIGHFLESISGEENASLLLQTINSFSELLDDKFDIESIKIVVKNLLQSYNEIVNNEDPENSESLAKNLFSIFLNYKSLKDILDCRTLAFENENILNDTKILTDIRLIIAEKDELKRNGVILQKLQIEFTKGTEKQLLYLTLDTDDLNNLKNQIEEALTKETTIKEDYKNIFSFI